MSFVNTAWNKNRIPHPSHDISNVKVVSNAAMVLVCKIDANIATMVINHIWYISLNSKIWLIQNSFFNILHQYIDWTILAAIWIFACLWWRNSYTAWSDITNRWLGGICVHGANMGATWVLSAPDGPHVRVWHYKVTVIGSQWTIVCIRSSMETCLISHVTPSYVWIGTINFNTSRAGDEYIRQWNESQLV